MAARYLKKESSNLFIDTELIFEKIIADHSGQVQVCEDQELYEVKSARKTLEGESPEPGFPRGKARKVPSAKGG